MVRVPAGGEEMEERNNKQTSFSGSVVDQNTTALLQQQLKMLYKLLKLFKRVTKLSKEVSEGKIKVEAEIQS